MSSCLVRDELLVLWFSPLFSAPKPFSDCSSAPGPPGRPPRCIEALSQVTYCSPLARQHRHRVHPAARHLTYDLSRRCAFEELMPNPGKATESPPEWPLIMCSSGPQSARLRVIQEGQFPGSGHRVRTRKRHVNS